MPSPGDDRMDALSEAVVRILRRLDGIERRLSRIEAASGISQVAEPPYVPEPPPSLAPPPPAAETAAPPPIPEPVPIPDESEAPRGLETRVGLTWINRAGVLTSVCAVAFFFKLAVDNQWIGESGRVALGVLAGFATLGLAEYMWRRGHRIYAQGITATGISILYLSFYAAFGFYALVGQGPAFLLMALTTAMAGALALRYNALAISVLSLIGGYLTPILLSTNQDRPWIFFGWVLLLDVGALAVARARKWRPLEILAFAGTLILYLTWFVERFNPEKQVVATVYALAFYALFAVVKSRAPFIACQVLASLAILAIWSPPAVPFLWLSLALALAGLTLCVRRNWPGAPLAVFGAFWACCAIWQADLSQPPRLLPIILAFTAGFLLFLGWVTWKILVQRAAARQQDLLIVALNGAIYFALCYHLLEPGYHAYLGLFAAAMAGIHLLLGLRFWNARPAEQRDTRPVLLCIGVALGFLTLAAPIQFSSYRITMAWALEAAALTWIGIRTGARRLVWAALLVFFLTLARLYSIDAWIFSGDAESYYALWNVRFLTFLTAAFSLWLGARWIGTGVEAMAPYIAGHFVMLWALALEVLGWAARSTPAENVFSVQSVSVSVLMAAYGVFLVGMGVFTRLGINRILGLGLLALVVAKLYLYDVWQLARVYRVVAFGLLGLLLLVTSFLYSRYRTTIEDWWKNEKGSS